MRVPKSKSTRLQDNQHCKSASVVRCAGWPDYPSSSSSSFSSSSLSPSHSPSLSRLSIVFSFCIPLPCSKHPYFPFSLRFKKEQARSDEEQKKSLERQKENKAKAESRAEWKQAKLDAKNTKELKMTVSVLLQTESTPSERALPMSTK